MIQHAVSAIKVHCLVQSGLSEICNFQFSCWDTEISQCQHQCATLVKLAVHRYQ